VVARAGRTGALCRDGRAARGSGGRVARLTRGGDWRTGPDGGAAATGDRGWLVEIALGDAAGMTAVAVTSPTTGTARRFH
jgi:hypothetical protein